MHVPSPAGSAAGSRENGSAEDRLPGAEDLRQELPVVLELLAVEVRLDVALPERSALRESSA